MPDVNPIIAAPAKPLRTNRYALPREKGWVYK